MDTITIGLIISGLLLVFVFLGMRVGFAAALAGLVGLVWVFWSKKGFDPAEFFWAVTIAAKIAGQVPHSKIASQALSLIPTFILIGYLAYYAGLTKALFEAAKRWIGWLPGGLAVATVFSTAGFAAVSGASIATSAVFARVAIPEMLAEGYDKRFAAGVVAAAGTLASLIPPSAVLVIYAIIVEQNVGALLLAGFLPGAFSAVVYGGLVVGMAMAVKNFGPPVGGFTWARDFSHCRASCRFSLSSPSSSFSSTTPSAAMPGARRQRAALLEPLLFSSWRFIRACAGRSCAKR